MPAIELRNQAVAYPAERKAGERASTLGGAERTPSPEEVEAPVSRPEQRIQRDRIEHLNPKMLPTIRQGLDTHWLAADRGGAELMTAATGMPVRYSQVHHGGQGPKTMPGLPPLQTRATELTGHTPLSRVRTSLGLILVVVLLLALLIAGL